MFDYIVDYAGIALAWLLFMAIPFLAAGMLYRAWKRYNDLQVMRSASGHDIATGIDLRTESNYVLVNVACGLGLCMVFAGVLFYGLAFATWSGSAAILVWIYFASMRILEKGKAAKPNPS